MPVLIDGHNLIGKIHHISLADENDEEQLVLLLRRYAARKRGRHVVVIFDGGIYGHPKHLNGYNVECHFAKKPLDADKELIRRICAIRRKDVWVVVSSDRAVMGAAQAHGIAVMSSQEFASILEQRTEDIPRKQHSHDTQCNGLADRKDRQTTTPTDNDESYKHRLLSEREVEEWLSLFEQRSPPK